MEATARTEKIEFRNVILPGEMDALLDVDRKIFHAYPADLFTPEEWAEFESHWMIVDGKIVGCTAFVRDTDYDDEPRRGCLHIMSTGVLPELRRTALGMKQKLWQIDFARQQGFHTIVTNTRQSNVAMLQLNLKLGFVIREVAPHFYYEPDEPAIVMELQL